MKRTLRNIFIPMILLAFMNLDVAIFPYCPGSRPARRDFNVYYFICENGEFKELNYETMRSYPATVNLDNLDIHELDGYQFVGYVQSPERFDTLQDLTNSYFGTNFERYNEISSSFSIYNTTYFYPFYVRIDKIDAFIESKNADVELIYIENRIDGTIENHRIMCKWNDTIFDILPEIEEYEGYEIEYFYPYFDGKEVDASSKISFMDKRANGIICIESKYTKVKQNENQ